MKNADHMPAAEFNEYQRGAVHSYGISQSAVDYILSQRYGGEHLGGRPVEREGFGMVADRGREDYGALRLWIPGWGTLRSMHEAEVRPGETVAGTGGDCPSTLELRYRGLY